MDDLDRRILSLLAQNARMPVKEIAEQVSLTSPAVSSRIHKMETDGIISGYTVTLNRPADRMYVDALISLSVAPSHREELLDLLQNSKAVLQCYHVTGEYTFLIKVSCGSMPQLEHLILEFQKLGSTSTQIILSTPVNHGELDALML
ncbi:MAG: Lrp/AsnC family transcriptional regulator [Faecalibacterium sp.]